MGWFISAEERKRRADLAALEDKRLEFAARARELGIVPECGLYAQFGGGFVGAAVQGEARYWITGPAPGAEEDFSIARLPRAKAWLESRVIPSEGFGGALGMGKKGAEGYVLHVECDSGAAFEMELLAGRNAYLETKGPGPLFSNKRSRGNANFVWEMRPMERHAVEEVMRRWCGLMGG